VCSLLKVRLSARVLNFLEENTSTLVEFSSPWGSDVRHKLSLNVSSMADSVGYNKLDARFIELFVEQDAVN
jgi:hypothetical protein